jgi:methylthioribose-1-phosphate isomerase
MASEAKASEATASEAKASEATPSWEHDLAPLRWVDGALELLDQRLLPGREQWLRYEDGEGVAQAIREMVVRGAPAIGCAAALGLAASARRYPEGLEQLRRSFEADYERLSQSRPTAVNLFWALDRQRRVAEQTFVRGKQALAKALEAEALAIWRDDLASCRAIGRHGAQLLPDGAGVLTHCNAGALATGGYGTALGVIRGAVEAGKGLRVFADETRPVLQGGRLTAWELQRSGIGVTLICDNMAGALMQAGEITHCVVGADRIARNGDAANKIGTYMVAALAARHGLPFYVAAPLSTIDLAIPTGSGIPIEQREAEEVTYIGDKRIAPEGIAVRNIAFDVTPAELIAGIITEAGIAYPPYAQSLPRLAGSASGA